MRLRWLAATMPALALAGCPAGYRFQAAYEPHPVSDAIEQNLLEARDEALEACRDHVALDIHCESQPELCRRDLSRPGAPPLPGVERLEPRLSFVHVSDAQLKEHRVSIEGALSESWYDGLVSGSARHPELERYDFAVLLATVLGINRLVESAPAEGSCPSCARPAFVLHTGDSVDAGMFSEFFEFLSVMEQLDVPFFNAVGNHDTLFFGTFPKRQMRGYDVVLPYVPLGDLRRFLLAHHVDGCKADLSIPCEMSQGHTPMLPGMRRSAFHGFDLICSSEPRVAEARTLCPDAHGYYAFDTWIPAGPLPAEAGAGAAAAAPGRRRVRVIVLNTSEIEPETPWEAVTTQQSRGYMRSRQYLWLSSELSRRYDEPTSFIVAGHHTLENFMPEQNGWLRNLLLREPRVMAYLSGHTHRNAIHSHARAPTPLWEITAGSTLVAPQFGLLIDLLQSPPDADAGAPWYLRVRSFREGLSRTPSCARLAQQASWGQRGARQDVNDQDNTPEGEALPRANGLLPVTPF